MTDGPRAQELLSQLGARARQQWDAATEARLQRDQEELSDPAADPALVARVMEQLEQPEAAAEVSRSQPRPRSRPRSWVPALIAVAAMVALMLWLRPGRVPADIVPEYREVMFEGGIRPTRADAADGTQPPRLEGTSLLRWRLTPQTRVDIAVDIRIAAVGAEHRCLTVSQGKQIMPTGAIELLGSVHQLLPLPPGSWTLTVLVGSTARLATLANPCARSDDGSWPAGVRAAASRLVVIAPTAR
ncbi:MAG: hypothetical protein K0V04_19945 [Deltaproteobacteria bacterium]|nr:hypothetical protein [Deltaproteobacteria bacterium]